MHWDEAKRIFSLVSIICLLGWSMLALISYGPLLQDKEFESAAKWAEKEGLTTEQELLESPFSFITRAEAAKWYVAFAQSTNMPLYSNDICSFNDIDFLPKEQQDMIMLACGYRFFWGSKGGFHPDDKMTKAVSLVALMKGFYPKKDWGEKEPYWEPFVNESFEIGITKRQSDPYMMYLLTRYELILQLYRAYQFKSGTLQE